MTRHDQPIQKATIRNRLHHGVEYSSRFEEWEACIEAGLDIERWENGEYENSFKAYVIAWHRLHNMVDTHVQDAAMTESKRRSKR